MKYLRWFIIAPCFSVYYGSPESNLANFLDYLDNFFGFINDNIYYVICGDDYNAFMLGDNTHKENMNTLASSSGCVNVINLHRRLTAHSNTLINLFITNFDIIIQKVGLLSWRYSDHLLIHTCVKNHTV